MAAGGLSIFGTSDDPYARLAIGEKWLLHCLSGKQRVCRASFFVEGKDGPLVALPSRFYREVTDRVVQHSWATCLASRAEIGPCDMVADIGNLCLARLPFDYPKTYLRNFVTVDAGDRVPHYCKRNTAKLTDCKRFLLHKGGVRPQVLDIVDRAFQFSYGLNDGKLVALPISDDTASQLDHEDIGASVTTSRPAVDASAYIPACGIYSGMMEVKREDRSTCKCCIVAPLWPAMNNITRHNLGESLKMMKPVMEAGFDPSRTAIPVTNITPDILESLTDMFTDSAYFSQP